MDINEAIITRRSVRRFLDREIPDKAIDFLIEAVRWAPSAGNLQARKFFFVFKRELKIKIANAALNQMFIASAPLVVVACGDLDMISPYGRRGRELYMIQDVAVSVENLMLQACGLGLGSVWVGAFDERGIKDILDLPQNLTPVAIIPVGYPAQEPKAPERLPKEEAVKIIR